MDSPHWDIPTLSLYLFIIFSTYFISFFIIKFRFSPYGNQINYVSLFSIFLLFWIFSAIRIIGTDYPVYEEIFNASNSVDRYDYGIEPGFLWANRFVRFFTSDSRVFFATVSFTTILLVFLALIRYKTILNLPFSIFVYSTLYYFQSYSLVRIYLASAILLFSYDFLITKRYFIFFFLFLISSSIHYSTLLLLLPIFGLFLYEIRKSFFYIYLFTLSFFLYVFLDHLAIFNIFDRYSGYIEDINSSSKFGIGQIFFNGPILAMLIVARKDRTVSDRFIDVTIVFTWFCLLFGTLGYWIPTIARVNYLITFPFILFVPIFLKSIRNKWKLILVYSFGFFYLSTRLYIYFAGLAFSDGIDIYYTIFNNK